MRAIVIPGYCGIFDNEIADELASSGEASKVAAEEKSVKPPIDFFFTFCFFIII